MMIVQLGIAVRTKITPKNNHDARTLYDLIDWTSISEPPLTCNKTTGCLKSFIDYPMQVPDWPSHTQSIERCVKMVTETAGFVYS